MPTILLSSFINICSAQKFFVNDVYWQSSDGPVFLYIGGEGPLSKFSLLFGQHHFFSSSSHIITFDLISWEKHEYIHFAKAKISTTSSCISLLLPGKMSTGWHQMRVLFFIMHDGILGALRNVAGSIQVRKSIMLCTTQHFFYNFLEGC